MAYKWTDKSRWHLEIVLADWKYSVTVSLPKMVIFWTTETGEVLVFYLLHVKSWLGLALFWSERKKQWTTLLAKNKLVVVRVAHVVSKFKLCAKLLKKCSLSWQKVVVSFYSATGNCESSVGLLIWWKFSPTVPTLESTTYLLGMSSFFR